MIPFRALDDLPQLSRLLLEGNSLTTLDDPRERLPSLVELQLEGLYSVFKSVMISLLFNLL